MLPDTEKLKLHWPWVLLSCRLCLSLIVLADLLQFGVGSAQGQTLQTWTGGASGTLSNPAGWSGGTVPGQGDSWLFTNSAMTLTNSLPQNYTVNGILFSNVATVTSASLTNSTQFLTLTGGITNSQTTAGLVNLSSWNFIVNTNVLFTNTMNSASSQLRVGQLSGTGTVTYGANGGSARLILQTAAGNMNAFTGRIIAISGRVDIGSTNGVSSNTAYTFNNSGGVYLGGTNGETNFNFGVLDGTNTAAIILNNTGTNSKGFSVGGKNINGDFAGSISSNNVATISVNKVGSATQTLSGINTYTGTTTIGGGVLQLGNGGTRGSISNSSSISLNGGSLAVNRSDSVSQGGIFTANALTGTGGFIQAGTGTMTLTAANTYTGTTTVSAGTLAIAAGSSLLSTNIVVNGGTMTLAAGSSVASTNIVVNGGTLRVNGTNTSSDVIVNSGGTLSGVGTLGNVTVANGGTITSGGTNGTGVGTLTASNLTMNGGSTYLVNSTGPQTNDLISVPGLVTFTNTNTLITIALTSDANFSNWTRILSSSNSISGYSANVFRFTLFGSESGEFSITSSNSNTELYIKFSPSSNNIILTSIPGTISYQSASTNSAGINGQVNVGLVGGGEFVLDVTNSYVGTTTIAAGTLTAQNSNSFGSSLVSVGTSTNLGSNAIVSINNTSPVTVPNNIIVQGSGTNVILNSSTGAVTYSGNITLQTNATMSNSAVGNLIASGKISGPGVLTIGAGTGTITLTSANNDYTGGTRLNSGTLLISNIAALGSGSLTVNGNSTLTATTDITFAKAVLITNAVATLSTFNNWTNSGVVSGNGSLTKAGSGTIFLMASNSYSGATAVNGGSLVLGNSNALPASATLTLGNNSTLDLMGFNATVGGLSSSGSGASIINSGTNAVRLTVSNALTDNSSYNGTISGAIGLTKNGGGTLTLSASNSYTDGTILNAGTLIVSNTFALSTNTVTVNSNATLRNTSYDLYNDIVLSGGSTTLTIDVGAGSSTNSGVISGNGVISKIGTGTLALITFSGTNSYTGGTILNAGTLLIDDPSNLGAASGTLTFAGASTLSITTNPSFADSRNYVLNASATINIPNGFFTNAGVISGSGSLTKRGGGLLALAGINIYTGTTTVSQGTLQLGTNGTIGSISNSTVVLSGGTLAFNRSDLLIQGSNFPIASSSLTNSGGFSQTGSGTTILTTNNTYSGTTTVSAGVLQIGIANGTNGSISNSANITLNGGFLAFNRSDLVTQGVNFLTNSNSMTGTRGGFMQMGSGTIILTTSNTYSGDTIVTNGLLRLTHSNAIQNSVLSLVGGGTLQFGTNVSSAQFAGLKGNRSIGLTNIATPSSNVTLTLNNASNTNTIYSGALSGGGSLILVGTGTQTLSGSNSYTGGTTLSNGTLAIGNNNALGRGTLTVNSTNATLQNTNLTLTLTNSIVLVSNSTTLTMDTGDGNWTNNGSISSDGAIRKVGNGTLVLNSSNNYAGGTILNGGTVVMGDSNALGTGGLTVNSNATLQNANFTLNKVILLNSGSATLTMDSGSGSWTNNGQISGGGALLKTGSGFLVLAFANSYSGGTSLSDGTLVLSDPSALGASTGALNISGGTLVNEFEVGVGTVTLGSATIAGGGTIGGASFTATNSGNLLISNSLAGTNARFIQSGVGTTTFYASNSYTGGTLLTNGGTLIAGANALGTGRVTNFGGVLDLGGNTFTNTFTLGSGTIINGTISTTTNFTQLTNGTVASVLTGVGGLIMSGTGTLTLLANFDNTYTGATVVNGGTLVAGRSSSLSTNSVAVNAGFLNLSGLTFTNTFALNGGVITNGTISNSVLNQFGNGTISAGLIGTGTLDHGTSGTLTLSGDNKYTGGTVLTNGTIVATTTNALGAGGRRTNGSVTIGNATLFVSKTNTLLTLGNGIAIQGAATVTLAYDSSITNRGNIFITNSTPSSINVISLDTNSWKFQNVTGTYELISGKAGGITGASSNSIKLVFNADGDVFNIPFGTTQTNTNPALDQIYTFTNNSRTLLFYASDIWRPIQSIPKSFWVDTSLNTTNATATATNGGVLEISTSPFGVPPRPLSTSTRTLSAVLNGKGQVVVFPSNSGSLYTNVPAEATSGVTRISAGYSHIMALKGGKVITWPSGQVLYNGTTNTPPQALSGVVEISAGYNSCLALKSDGSVVAWGDKYSASSIYKTGVYITSLRNIMGIADGKNNGLALDKSGTVLAFGKPFNTSLYPYPIDASFEVNALRLTNVAAISISSSYALALRKDGTVVAWGEPGNLCTQVPEDLSNVISISAGGDYALALKADGSVVSWGDSNAPGGQIPPGLLPVAAIEAGFTSYSLVARKNNGIYPLDDCNSAGGMKGGGGGGGGQQWNKPIPWSTPIPWGAPPSTTAPNSTKPITPVKWTLPQRWN